MKKNKKITIDALRSIKDSEHENAYVLNRDLNSRSDISASLSENSKVSFGDRGNRAKSKEKGQVVRATQESQNTLAKKIDLSTITTERELDEEDPTAETEPTLNARDTRRPATIKPKAFFKDK